MRSFLQELIDILSSTFGIEDQDDLSKKATAVLAQSAEFVASSYILNGGENAPPISIDAIMLALNEYESDSLVRTAQAVNDAIIVSLDFTQRLGEVSQQTGRKIDALHKQLLDYSFQWCSSQVLPHNQISELMPAVPRVAPGRLSELALSLTPPSKSFLIHISRVASCWLRCWTLF